MSLVMVRYQPWVNRIALAAFVDKLPAMVASALSVPGTQAHLEPSEVEVVADPFGEYAIAQGFEVTVTILANDYPERREKLEVAADELEGAVRPCFPEGTAIAIWPLLAYGAFRAFGVRKGKISAR